MNHLFKGLALILAILIISSCGSDQVYKKHHKFEKNTWKRMNDDVVFEVDIEDNSRKYDIIIPIRHASFYPHQFIEIGFNIYSPEGQASYSERKIYLKDPEGNWKGKGMGDIWDFDYTYFEGYTFNEAGEYTIELQNLTGNNIFLPGVMEIGLIIKKTKLK